MFWVTLDRYVDWSSQPSSSAFSPPTKFFNLIGFLKIVSFSSSSVGIVVLCPPF